MRITARIKTTLRRLRFACGGAPRTNEETSDYLRRIAVTKAQDVGPLPLKMPWGIFTCTNIGVARAQFEEIVVNRQYAFKTSSANPTIIDCGGNVGMSAIWFLQSYPQCRLTVYEADAELAGILKANLANAGYPDAHVLNRAVWTADGEIAFSSTGVDTGKIDPLGSGKVKAVDLAASLPNEVDLLKIDIEGAEFDVLDRLLSSGTINTIRNLAVEFHPTRKTFPQMLEIFLKLEHAGYRVSFESFLGPFCGLEAADSQFEAVGRNRMFVQAYIWRA